MKDRSMNSTPSYKAYRQDMATKAVANKKRINRLKEISSRPIFKYTDKGGSPEFKAAKNQARKVRRNAARQELKSLKGQKLSDMMPASNRTFKATRQLESTGRQIKTTMKNTLRTFKPKKLRLR